MARYEKIWALLLGLKHLVSRGYAKAVGHLPKTVVICQGLYHTSLQLKATGYDRFTKIFLLSAVVDSFGFA